MLKAPLMLHQPVVTDPASVTFLPILETLAYKCGLFPVFREMSTVKAVDGIFTLRILYPRVFIEKGRSKCSILFANNMQRKLCVTRLRWIAVHVD